MQSFIAKVFVRKLRFFIVQIIDKVIFLCLVGIEGAESPTCTAFCTIFKPNSPERS